MSPRSNLRLPVGKALLVEAATYRRDLEALSSAELARHVAEENERETAERIAKLKLDEQKLFFNRPDAAADFSHWSKAAHWTLDEAIALSFGKSPEIVNWKNIQSSSQTSSTFLKQYALRRDLALRATAWKQLFDPVLPGIFLAWAKRIDIPVPSELVAAVEKVGVQVADWKSEFDELVVILRNEREAYLKRAEEHEATLRGNSERWSELVAGKDALIAALRTRSAKLENTLAEHARNAAELELRPRERESLLKLVIGMAVKGYAYDPKATRSKTTSEIASDLETAGVPLDADTVRKWLHEAIELLPLR